MDGLIAKLRPVFEQFPCLKLAYLFGSRARGSAGPLSDFDFAVYFDTQAPQEMFELQSKLIDALSRALQTDKVEVVVLNRLSSPEMKYRIITEGILITAVEPFRVLVEPQILNEYFDFRSILRRHRLTGV
jgi:predicted nucleotidyltransferase